MVTLLGLAPLLQRLPRVSVVACFDAGHPLYQWVPSTTFDGGVHCVSAPAPVVSWTLMVAATLLVQLLLLPPLVAAGALLVRGGRRLADSADRILAAVFEVLRSPFAAHRQPVPVRVRRDACDGPRSRENPHRGPPSRCC